MSKENIKMKKTSTACFVIGIVVLAVSAALIIFSFLPNTVQHYRGIGYWQIEYTSFNTYGSYRQLIMGCTGIISGLLLFILSTLIKCEHSGSIGKCSTGTKSMNVSADKDCKCSYSGIPQEEDVPKAAESQPKAEEPKNEEPAAPKNTEN